MINKSRTADIQMYKQIGENLKILRLHNNLSRKEVGEIIDKTEGSIAAYEKGENDIPFSVFIKLCEMYKIDNPMKLLKPLNLCI